MCSLLLPHAYTRPDVAPGTRILEAYASMTWSVAEAIAEYIDNSFGAGRGNARDVWIESDRQAHTIVVRDNGRGMETPTRLLKFGDGSPPALNDTGLYGFGGKYANVWLSSGLRVETFDRATRLYHDMRARWADMIASGEWNTYEDVGPQALPPSDADRVLVQRGHGTSISLHLRPERYRFHEDTVKRELSDMYAPGLAEGYRIWWNGELLTPPNWPAQQQPFSVIIEADSKQFTASGHAWMDESLSLDRSGVDFCMFYRVAMRHIRTVFLGRGTSGIKCNGQGIRAVVRLGAEWQPLLSTTKTSIKREPLYQALLDGVADALAPLMREQQRAVLQVELPNLNLVAESLQTALSGVLGGRSARESTTRPPHRVTVKHDPPGRRDVPPIISQREATDNGHSLVPGGGCAIQVMPTPLDALGGRVCDVEIDEDKGAVLATIGLGHLLYLQEGRDAMQVQTLLQLEVMAHVAMQLVGLPTGVLERLLPDKADHGVLSYAPALRAQHLLGIMMRSWRLPEPESPA